MGFCLGISYVANRLLCFLETLPEMMERIVSRPVSKSIILYNNETIKSTNFSEITKSFSGTSYPLCSRNGKCLRREDPDGHEGRKCKKRQRASCTKFMQLLAMLCLIC